MSKLIKRKDGSYSKRGLWDNIRKNKGSGKEPTKEMLKQESKIKKEENMNSMYKKGGKTSKKKVMKEARKEGESFMEENKEINFEAPGVKPPMRKMMMGGGTETGMQVNGRMNRAMGEATMAGKKKYKDGGPGKGLFEKVNDTTNALSASAASKKADANFDKAARFKTTSSEALDTLDARSMRASKASREAIQKANQKKTGGKKMMYKKGGFPDLNNDNEITFGDVLKGRLKGSNPKEKMMGGKMEYKKGGKKTMEPGGGGRFAKMVSGLKKEGKSEDSAKAIAASAGRKKYGNSKFQAMAAAGKKKMMGGKKC